MTQAAFGIQAEPSKQDRAALPVAREHALNNREKTIGGKASPPSEFPFPNYDAGPKRPRPTYTNFYKVDDKFPTYLMCFYDVEGKSYIQTKEPEWFQKSLEEIRRLGSGKFPPVKWIAVIITNRGDGKHTLPLDKWFTVGAVFKASEVFNSSQDTSKLVGRAEMDRNPFLFDPQQPTLDSQRKWLILERHMITNRAISE